MASLMWTVAVVMLGMAPVPGAVSARVEEDRGALFLVPEEGEIEVGGAMGLRLERGDVGVDGGRVGVAWEGEAVSWFYVRGAGTQENRDSPAGFAVGGEGGVRGGGMEVAVPVTRAGVMMIGVERAARVEVMEGAAWREFAQGEFSAEVAGRVMDAGGEGGVRVRWVESAKVVVRVGVSDEVVDSQVSSSKAGQAGEVRLLQDATALMVGSDVQMRAYSGYASGHGARVRAACDGCGEVQAFTGDKYGIGLVTLREGGVWRVVGRGAERLEGDAEADVVVHSFTLVFNAGSAATKEGE